MEGQHSNLWVRNWEIMIGWELQSSETRRAIYAVGLQEEVLFTTHPCWAHCIMLCVAIFGAGAHELIPRPSMYAAVCSIIHYPSCKQILIPQHYEMIGDLFLSGIEWWYSMAFHNMEGVSQAWECCARCGEFKIHHCYSLAIGFVRMPIV